MRALIPALIAATVALVPALAVLGRGEAARSVRFVSVPLDPDNSMRARIGELRYLGGWELKSRDRRFGGLSAIVPTGPGRFLALSDAAQAVAIDLAARRADILPVLDAAADPRSGKSAYDTEAATADPATGRIWAALERRNAILRYDRGLRLVARTKPAAMKEWPPNGGAEGLALLPDGRMLVVAESYAAGPGLRRMLVFPGDPTVRRMKPLAIAFRPPARHEPSDAAALPDGRVLVLTRRVSLPFGFESAVSVINPRRARPGAVVEGRIIAMLPATLRLDNLEGLAVTREGGRTILTLVSDDNFLPVQRTLLLRFAWDGG